MERSEQFIEEERGLDVQYASLGKQLEIAKSELSDIEQLYAKNLVPRTRVSQLQREVVRIEGAMAEIVTKTPQTKGRRTEIALQIATVEGEFLSDVSKDLREAETKINELLERRTGAEDQLTKVEIRAPISGQVHQLQVHTVGGVVSPAEPLLLIVQRQRSYLWKCALARLILKKLRSDRWHVFVFRGFPLPRRRSKRRRGARCWRYLAR